jgi:serine phosphatase RsbU (regulator of sigma subunit)
MDRLQGVTEENIGLQHLLSAWERVVDLEDLEQICSLLGETASQLYGCPTEIVLATKCDDATFGNPVVATDTDEVLAYVRFRSQENALSKPLDQLFLRLVSWSITHSKLRDASKQRRELMESLGLARRILEESLPTDKLRTDCWEISGRLRPAQHLGGDIFAYSTDSGKLGFLLADAVGHGLDSALLASECRALWRALQSSEDDLCDLVARLSTLLYANTGTERYVAATFGRCYADGRVELVCCGQGPHWIISESGVSSVKDPDLPLGLFPDQEFRIKRLQVEPGQTILLASDGVIDLRNDEDLEFGEERVRDVIAAPRNCPQGLLDSLLGALDLYRGRRPQADDICCLALTRPL